MYLSEDGVSLTRMSTLSHDIVEIREKHPKNHQFWSPIFKTFPQSMKARVPSYEGDSQLCGVWPLFSFIEHTFLAGAVYTAVNLWQFDTGRTAETPEGLPFLVTPGRVRAGSEWKSYVLIDEWWLKRGAVSKKRTVVVWIFDTARTTRGLFADFRLEVCFPLSLLSA